MLTCVGGCRSKHSLVPFLKQDPSWWGSWGVEAVTIEKGGVRKSEKGDLVCLGVTRRSGKASRRR